MPPDSTNSTDVIVIGAGFAGLAAARELVRGGRSVRVLESRDRVGGRAFTVGGPGVSFDLGGQWVGPGQKRVLKLLKDYGHETYPQYEEGSNVVLRAAGGPEKFKGKYPPVACLDWIPVRLASARLAWETYTVHCVFPWSRPAVDALDGMSLADWIERRTGSAAARELLTVLCRSVFCCEPREISAYFALVSMEACGGLSKVIDKDGGAQAFRVAGGVQPLTETLAAELGDRIRLRCSVRALGWSETGVDVVTDAGVYRARRAILTAPPSTWPGIRFTPELPEGKRELGVKMPMGAVIKCFVFYRSAFWKERGLSGEVLSGRPPLSFVVDACFKGGQPALVAFFFGDQARRHAGLGAAERRRVVLDALAEMFGDAREGDVVAYRDHDWVSEPGTLGGYSGILGPDGAARLMRELRTSCGALHFAGTETAKQWPGYFEGALESGERAADEVELGLSGQNSEQRT